MDLGLDGVVAAVAGGTAGLGLASARALAAEGAVVAVCGRSAEGVDAARAEGFDATAVDVVDHAAAQAWVEAVATRHGRLDVLVANAGGPPAGTATAFDVDAYRAALELSLLSQIALVQAALPHLRRAPAGRVLFITSKTVREPMTGLALSNTARAGVVGYAKSLVRDLGDQDRAAGRTGTVTVNVLAPGYTRTGRLEALAGDDVDAGLEAMAAEVPLGRVGRPEEFAAAVTFLASAVASFISGVVLPVDGGEIRAL
jgi:3-oxoacyl-[acyl-carrier protein] reductase